MTESSSLTLRPPPRRRALLLEWANDPVTRAGRLPARPIAARTTVGVGRPPGVDIRNASWSGWTATCPWARSVWIVIVTARRDRYRGGGSGARSRRGTDVVATCTRRSAPRRGARSVAFLARIRRTTRLDRAVHRCRVPTDRHDRGAGMPASSTRPRLTVVRGEPCDRGRERRRPTRPPPASAADIAARVIGSSINAATDSMTLTGSMVRPSPSQRAAPVAANGGPTGSWSSAAARSMAGRRARRLRTSSSPRR